MSFAVPGRRIGTGQERNLAHTLVSPLKIALFTFMKKTFVTQREIKRHIRRRAALEKIFYIISFFVAPFVFYITARHKYLFDDVDDEELQLYLDAERRYAIVTIIWLLSIIAILLLIVVVKI